MNKYNAKVDYHRRLVDQANRAKERYEDAVARFNEKKADLEEQIREKLEALRPALDQDILTVLGKMQQMAYDNIRNKDKHFEGFLLSYLAKKAYIFLYDHIDSTAEQRAATDIFKKLDDEFDIIMSSNGGAVREGLHKAASFLSDCHQTNAALQRSIGNSLQRLPYQLCRDNESQVRGLLNLPAGTEFQYQHIIDPAELARVEEAVRGRRAEFERNIRAIDDFAARFNPTFGEIASVRDFADTEFKRMRDHKVGALDPVGKDTFFAFGIFDDEDQEQYMKKHKQWLQGVRQEIEQSLSIDLLNLVRTVRDTELLTMPTRKLLDADPGLLFFGNQQKLAQKRQQFVQGIAELDSTLLKIDELPREKSEKFTRKMSVWLYLSLLPLGNVLALLPVGGMIKEYMPALTSSNASYVALKEAHAKKLHLYSYIHLALTLASGVVTLLVAPPAQWVLLAVAFTYLVSMVGFFLKGGQLKKL